MTTYVHTKFKTGNASINVALRRVPVTTIVVERQKHCKVLVSVCSLRYLACNAYACPALPHLSELFLHRKLWTEFLIRTQHAKGYLYLT